MYTAPGQPLRARCIPSATVRGTRGRGDGHLVDVHHRALALAVGRGAPGDEHQRHAPCPGVDEPGERVAEPGPGGDRSHADVAGGQSPSLRSQGRGALMTCIDDAHVLVDAGIEQRQDVAAGDAEHRRHTGRAMRARQQRAAGEWRVRGHGGSRLADDVSHDVLSSRHRESIVRPGGRVVP